MEDSHGPAQGFRRVERIPVLPPVVLPAPARAGALLLVGCARGTSTDGAGAQSGGGSTDTLRIAVPSDPGSLDQDYLAFDLVGLALMKNYYPYLIDHPYVRQGDAMVQDTTKALPVIAESWTSDDTGRVWTLKLKQGVTFPSGNELTADDVKWSRDRAFEAKANVAGIYRMIGLTEPGQVEVVDRYTVRFDQSKPSALSSAIQVIALYICDSVEMKKHATADDPGPRRGRPRTPRAAASTTSPPTSAAAR